jgi:hypothetical protein
MTEIINLPPMDDPSVSQVEMIEVLKKFIILQNQFEQLTGHVQECYRRIEALHKLLTNERLS